MFGTFLVLLGFFLVGMVFYWRVPLWGGAIASGLFTAFLLSFYSFFAFSPPWWLMALSVLASSVLIGLNMPVLRRRFITDKLLPFFKSKLPRISQTEREVLESGDTDWDAEIFTGHPDWRQLYAIPAPVLSPEESAFIEGPVEVLCSMLDDYHLVHQEKGITQPIWEHFKNHRYFAMGIPKSYGGLEFSPYAHSCVIAKIASRSLSTAVTVMVPNSLGPAELLLHYGTAKQREYYLPRLAEQKDIPCFGLTELQAGSDAGSIQAKGVIVWGEWQGERVLGICLNFQKRYITLAPVATLFGVAFKLFDPDRLLGGVEELGITLALVERGTKGLEASVAHAPLMAVFPNGRVIGRDIFIPLDAIIGGRERVGQGWRMLMSSLGAGRGISLPALGAAASQVAFETTLYYTLLRKQFSLNLIQFEGIQTILVHMAGLTQLIESGRKLTLAILGKGKKPAVISAIAKYHLTEMGRQVLQGAMDIQAGKAIMMGPRNIISHLFMSFPIGITVEGANILTRNLIIFGQGVIRCHPYVFKEFQALEQISHSDPEQNQQGRRLFDRILFQHIGYTCSNLIRMWVGGIRAGFSRSPSHHIRAYEAKLERAAAVLAVMSDVALLCLGGALKRHERLSARLGDMLSAVYLGSAILFDANHKGESQLSSLSVWALDEMLFRFWEAFQSILDSFPLKGLARFISFLARPFFDQIKRPSDALENQLIQELMKKPERFSHLSSCVYSPLKCSDLIGHLRYTFSLFKKLEPVLEKRQRKENLSDAEEKDWQDFEKLLNDALAVDEFPYKGFQPNASAKQSIPFMENSHGD